MTARKPILVGIDRDGTLIKDENYYLGSQEDWKDLIEYRPGIVRGMRGLKHAQGVASCVISNQAGVALEGVEGDRNFSNLTEARVNEVNHEIIWGLTLENANPDGIFFCPYVDEEYARKAREKGRVVNPSYIRDNHRNMKPNIGMLEEAAKYLEMRLEDFSKIYVIGDRLSDVQMAHNARGIGILVPDYKTIELGDVKKVEKLMREKPGSAFIFDAFDIASKFILETN